jgi:hypothetical protein
MQRTALRTEVFFFLPLLIRLFFVTLSVVILVLITQLIARLYEYDGTAVATASCRSQDNAGHRTAVQHMTEGH